MSENTSILRIAIRKVLLECGCGQPDQAEQHSNEKEPFYYLAPDVVDSINNLQMYPNKNAMSVGFDSTNGKKFNLVVPDDTIHTWMDNNEDGAMIDFVKAFLSASQPSEETGGEDMLDEIVDEDGNLIGAKDQPPNANFKQIGGSRKDSDAVIKQVIPKSKRYYGDMGLGFITWSWALFLGVGTILEMMIK